MSPGDYHLRTTMLWGIDIGKWLQRFLLFAAFWGETAAQALGTAQPYLVKVWGVEDGLPGSSVTDVAQADNGYLWVSTEEGGLSRFDGVRFVDFKMPIPSEFMSRGVRRILTASDGRLWLNGFSKFLASQSDGIFRWDCPTSGVINGLVLSKTKRIVFATKSGDLLEGQFESETNETWHTIVLPDATPNTTLENRIFADREGGVWYETTNAQVVRFIGNKAEVMQPGRANAMVTAFAGDKTGKIAIGTTIGLFIWSDGHFDSVMSDDNIPLLSVQHIVSDDEGGWWVDDINGRLRRLQKGRWGIEVSGWSNLRFNWPHVVQELADGQGGIWLASKNQGLIHISQDGRLDTISTAEGLPSNAVRNFILDYEGNVWVCFERGGLARVSSQVFQAIGKRDGFPDAVTTSVCEAPNGIVWAGTAGGQVICWMDGKCTNFTLPLTGSYCNRCTVFPDSRGRVWIGTQGNGVLVRENDKFRHVAFINDDLKVYALLVTQDGQVWIASSKGLGYVMGNEFRCIIPSKSETEYSTALAEGTNSTIWAVMATAELIRYQSGQIERFKPTNSNLLCRFTSLFQDTNGVVWIGTVGAGLLCFREGRFSSIGVEAGLPTENIFSLAEDGYGNIWFGSSVGIFSTKKADLEKYLKSETNTVSYRLYDCNDGLPTMGCAEDNQPAVWRNRNGRLWFAMMNGIASVLPSKMPAQKPPPLVMLEEVYVDGNSQKLPLDTHEPQEISLTPGRHLLEFRYTGLDYTDPEQLRFKYRLKGLENQWQMNHGERIATYSSLPPGKYSFQVTSCNSDGVWADPAATLSFNIPPYWWQTPWFHYGAFAGIIMTIGMAGFGMAHLRHARKIRFIEQSRAVESERVRIARDLHDDLGTTLTQIDLLGALVSRPGVPMNETFKQVEIIRAKSREMVTALDEIVWAVNPRNDSVKALVGYLGGVAEEFLRPSRVRLYLDFPDDLPTASMTAEARHNLFLAYKEALNNVVCHSDASEVTIRFVESGGQASFIIQDNGKGFKAGSETRKFGNGLLNMRQRMENIGGRYEMISQVGQGTIVKLVLPIM